MKNKILVGIFLIIILMANVSFASYSTVTMSVVEEPVCSITLGENSYFEKKLASADLTNKEVTIQLQVVNEEVSNHLTGEVILVIDNSISMEEDTSNGEVRKDLVFESAKTLITNLLKDNSSLKVGIVSFSTNVDTSLEGTDKDASVVSALSNNISTLTNAISNIEANGPRTDLQAGLLLASQQFTKTDNNKYMIVLTDGIPNVAIDYDNIYYSDDVISKTKEQLQTLDSQGINVITMLTGISDESYVPATTTKSFGEIIEEIFGTTTSPTVGSFYYITNDEIESTITGDIYHSLVSTKSSLKDITIVDYFPEEIVNNFDFAYVTQANIGTISAQIDATNNSITWTIPELESGETAIVQYTLKLKEDFDNSIVDQILNTNEKVDIDYTNVNDEKQSTTSDISPKIKLTEPPAVLPKAGTITLVGCTVFAAGLFIYSIINLTVLHKKTN